MIPQLQKFIALNKEEIVDALSGTIAFVEKATAAMLNFANALGNFRLLFTVLGSGILGVIGYIKILTAVATVKTLSAPFVGAARTVVKE